MADRIARCETLSMWSVWQFLNESFWHDKYLLWFINLTPSWHNLSFQILLAIFLIYEWNFLINYELRTRTVSKVLLVLIVAEYSKLQSSALQIATLPVVLEVPGSIPSQGPRHTKVVIKMVPVVPLFSTEHSKGKYWLSRIKKGK